MYVEKKRMMTFADVERDRKSEEEVNMIVYACMFFNNRYHQKLYLRNEVNTRRI